VRGARRGAGTERSEEMEYRQQPPKPGPEHKFLDVFIGKWINEGHTIATADVQSVKILTSDVYE
jgi:hypothetical protein